MGGEHVARGCQGNNRSQVQHVCGMFSNNHLGKTDFVGKKHECGPEDLQWVKPPSGEEKERI